MTKAKILSVQQPHADLILFGGKWCENRTWQTKYRGELFIHASRVDLPAMNGWKMQGCDPVNDSPGKCRTSAIIGSVMLFDVVQSDYVHEAKFFIDSKTNHKAIPERSRELVKLLRKAAPETWRHAFGPFCWILTDPQPIEPISGVKGKLGLWEYNLPKIRDFAAA